MTGVAKAYISAHVTTVESDCPHDVVVLIDAQSVIASEHKLFRRESGANDDIVGFLFPVRFEGRLEARDKLFSLRASSIERTGPIEVRRISELRRKP
jgi:hypothetical protein